MSSCIAPEISFGILPEFLPCKFPLFFFAASTQNSSKILPWFCFKNIYRYLFRKYSKIYSQNFSRNSSVLKSFRNFFWIYLRFLSKIDLGFSRGFLPIFFLGFLVEIFLEFIKVFKSSTRDTFEYSVKDYPRNSANDLNQNFTWHSSIN